SPAKQADNCQPPSRLATPSRLTRRQGSFLSPILQSPAWLDAHKPSGMPLPIAVPVDELCGLVPSQSPSTVNSAPKAHNNTQSAPLSGPTPIPRQLKFDRRAVSDSAQPDSLHCEATPTPAKSTPPPSVSTGAIAALRERVE